VLGLPAGRRAELTDWHDLLEGEELAHAAVEPARSARLERLPDGLDPGLVSALVAQGITRVYTHQAQTFGAAARGEHVIVTTGTASGKSLAFNLPALSAVAADPRTRVLYLYPTKALAQDQARALGALRVGGVRPAIYDGDTPPERRRQVRRFANCILTNPDMLHVGVLPHHDRWGDVLHNLRFVVVDEAHVYRGVFGSHVGNVLRRLRRLAHAYGSDPQFLLASATIANPAELARALTGVDTTVVDGDGAPRPERDVVLWNPALLDAELGLRASALGEAARLMAGLVERGLRTICFAKSRRAAELVHRFTSERVGPATARRLAPYRAGYTPQQRREIERRLTDGDLLGVSATDALELGIDVGSLDCAISVGFPGTVSSLRQQWGRAGRRDRGLAVLVLSEDALDQFFAREPEALLGRRVEAAILDHANPRILDPHVAAAAFEGPVTAADAETLGPEAVDRAALLPELERTAAGFVWRGREHPAARVSLRSGDAEAFTIVDEETGGVLGLVERERAYGTVHEGAVYLHLGDQYLVVSLDEVARIALVRPAAVDWYTQVRKETETAIEETRETRRAAGVELSFGHVSVTEQVVAYQRKAIRDGVTLEVVPLLLPATTFHTEAVWFSPGARLLDGLERMPTLLGTLHAAEHALISLLPLWAMCDRWDVGGLSTNVHFQTGLPTVFVYDGHAGGVGITARGYALFEGWAADTARLLAGCPCRDGCPSCVQSPKCGNLNDMLDKAGARTLLARMAGAPQSHVDPAGRRSS
jgi:DEAD/DEAH box helicase domain-containing protein